MNDTYYLAEHKYFITVNNNTNTVNIQKRVISKVRLILK